MPGTNIPGQPQNADVAWSPDGHWIAACLANSATVSVINADTGASSISYNGHTGGVNAVSCSPVTTSDGKLQFASGGFDKTVQIWQFTP
jgi:WD40 repeat protein